MTSRSTPPLSRFSFIFLSILTSIALGHAAPAQAQDNESCEGSTVEMHECISTQLTIADAELNKFYAALRAGLKVEMKSSDLILRESATEIDRRLVAAQRAWIVFRDADCSLQGADMLGGSGEGLLIHGCLLDKSRSRLRELKDFSF